MCSKGDIHLVIKTHKNRNILGLTGGALAIALLVLLWLFYGAIQRKVMHEAHDTVSNLLHIQQSIRCYVQNVVRPEVYRLQDEGILAEDYFSPELMSRSFVSSEILKLFTTQKNNGARGVVFRYASLSPLNPENKATSHEEDLIQRFEKGQLRAYEEETSPAGEDLLYFARPLDRFESRCMYCHGDPADAPESLVERYGSTHGFQRQVGQLSGIMSITIPLGYFQDQGQKTFFYVAAVTITGFILVFLVIYLLLQRKDTQDQLLLLKNHELDLLSTTDVLTGVWNRLRFNQEVDILIEKAHECDVALGMLLLDLDHFKKVNDFYGHNVGDEVLERFAGFLTRMCRRTDFIARFGGEEFVILIQGMDAAELEQYAQRLLHQMPQVEYPCDLRVTASIGLAELQRGEDRTQFFCRADQALYKSKEKGRYCYTMADAVCDDSEEM